jgi:hypothetical protein
MGTAAGAPGPQTARKVRAQGAAALHEQRLVDRLVRHPHLRIVRVIVPQPGRDLLGRPPRREEGFHGRSKAPVPGELGGPCSTGPAIATRLGQPGPIAPPAAVGTDLTRDRRGRPAQPGGDRPVRLAGTQPPADLLTLRERQAMRRADRPWRQATAASDDEADGARGTPDRRGDLLERHARPLERPDARSLDVGQHAHTSSSCHRTSSGPPASTRRGQCCVHHLRPHSIPRVSATLSARSRHDRGRFGRRPSVTPLNPARLS